MYLGGWRGKIVFLIFSEMINIFFQCLSYSVAKVKKMDQSWMVSCSNDMKLSSKIIPAKAGEGHLMALSLLTY